MSNDLHLGIAAIKNTLLQTEKKTLFVFIRLYVALGRKPAHLYTLLLQSSLILTRRLVVRSLWSYISSDGSLSPFPQHNGFRTKEGHGGSASDCAGLFSCI